MNTYPFRDRGGETGAHALRDEGSEECRGQLSGPGYATKSYAASVDDDFALVDFTLLLVSLADLSLAAVSFVPELSEESAFAGASAEESPFVDVGLAVFPADDERLSFL